MRELAICLAVLALGLVVVGFNAKRRVKRQHEIDVLYEHLCVDENGERDFYCLIFCPFIHDLFVYSLRQPIACSFDMGSSIDCSKKTDACTSWCTHLYDQLHMYYLHQRPLEWDVCASGDRPTGCDADPHCTKWCDLVHGSYQNASSAVIGCMTTGIPPTDCNDEVFCGDVCSTAERQRQNAEEKVLTCGWTGTAPWP